MKTYKDINVNTDNFIPFGEMNIIVQSRYNPEDNIVEYDNYMPRKNRIYNGTEIISDEKDKIRYIKHLRDSAERMKVFAYLLKQQANALESNSEVIDVYYPELNN